jgi:hypothetical protein
MAKPRLTLVSPGATEAGPRRQLGQHGMAFGVGDDCDDAPCEGGECPRPLSGHTLAGPLAKGRAGCAAGITYCVGAVGRLVNIGAREGRCTAGAGVGVNWRKLLR